MYTAELTFREETFNISPPAGRLISLKHRMASRMTFSAPQSSTSNISRAALWGIPSASDTIKYPALSNTTSIRPKYEVAWLNAVVIAGASVTSSGKVTRREEGYRVVRSSNIEGLRRVANTLSPLFKAHSVICRPRPVDEPVTEEEYFSCVFQSAVETN